MLVYVFRTVIETEAVSVAYLLRCALEGVKCVAKAVKVRSCASAKL